MIKRKPMPRQTLTAMALLPLFMLMSGCETLEGIGKPRAENPKTTAFPVDPDIAKQTKSPYRDLGDSQGKLLGDLTAEFPLPSLLGNNNDGDTSTNVANASQQPVNVYLWRASLDTVASLPIEIADVEGGLINTGWYEDPEKPDERYKVNIVVISDELRSDGVRIGLIKQERSGDGGAWRPKAASKENADELRAIIVGRALELSEQDKG